MTKASEHHAALYARAAIRLMDPDKLVSDLVAALEVADMHAEYFGAPCDCTPQPFADGVVHEATCATGKNAADLAKECAALREERDGLLDRLTKLVDAQEHVLRVANMKDRDDPAETLSPIEEAAVDAQNEITKLSNPNRRKPFPMYDDSDFPF